ncbi:MAG TPA: DUF6249 domain-containing protein [Cellvibrio sp.]|nr:DUF6249 domain-containing protein [Cellvibrio sp.]
MNITPLAHKVIAKLALVGLLFAPFALTPSYAAELVGKPVPVGAQAAEVAAAQVATKNAAAVNGTTAPVAQIAPIAPATPNAASEPRPPESPEAPELCAPNGVMQNTDEIRRAIDELRDSIHHDMPSDFGDLTNDPNVIIPVVAMLLLFGGPILLLIVLAVLHYRAKARRQQNINMNIDKLLAEGKDIPLEMLLGEEAAVMKPTMPTMPARPGIVLAAPRDDATMQKGVRNIGLGTGWLIFLTIMFSIEIGSFGFIFIGLGISQLAIWKLSSPSTNTGTNPKAEAPETLKAQD